MIAGKEELKFFEEQAEKQIQIYPDACDCGILLRDPAEKIPFRDNLQRLREIYKSTVTHWGDSKTCFGSETKLFVEFERAPEDMYSRGVFLTVSYAKDSVRKKEFISIDIIGGTQIQNPYKE
jgi:hypothetical protein